MMMRPAAPRWISSHHQPLAQSPAIEPRRVSGWERQRFRSRLQPFAGATGELPHLGVAHLDSRCLGLSLLYRQVRGEDKTVDSRSVSLEYSLYSKVYAGGHYAHSVFANSGVG